MQSPIEIPREVRLQLLLYVCERLDRRGKQLGNHQMEGLRRLFRGRCNPQPHARARFCTPHAAADALVVAHLPFAAKVAANDAWRTGHPKEDLEQLAAIGLIKASRRYDSHRPGRSPNHVIAYARPFVNGEITHDLRDKGFLISVPGRWRDLHARGQKLLRQGTPADQIPALLGLSLERWAEVAAACSVRVVAMGVGQGEELVW